MKITKQHIKEARKVYNLYWDSYQGGDLDAFASTLGEHFEMIGTSESEICHSKEDGIEFYKGQLEELVGKAEMRYRHINEIPHDDQVLINEICDIYTFLDSEWTFYSKLRISTLLRETSSGWKVVQQHCSFPDLRVQEGETLAIEKITKENLALRDAVKRRTAELENKNRELEIEAALERVRAIAMGMTKPDDMLDVCRVISDQLQQFGVEHIRNIQTAIIDEEIGRYLCYQYFTPYEKTTIEDTIYHKSPVEHAMVKKMLASRDERFIGILAGKELDEFRSHRKEVNQFPDPLLDESSELNYCFLSIGEGGLGLSLYQTLNQDVLSLFGRFHQVFTLAYRRFRDIEKAEAQARDSKIQLALERVRARSMAMQSSEELADVASILFEQLRALGGNLWGTGFGLCKENTADDEFWFANENGVFPPVSIPNTVDPAHKKMYEEWKNGMVFLSLEASGEDLTSHYEYMMSLPGVKPFFQKILDEGLSFPEWQQWNAAYFTQGYLLIITLEPYPEPDILTRFARVFDQTYTRFLDLKNAEEQARESEIQLALERVRARTMAMQNSDELTEASLVLDEQVRSLGIHTWGSAFHIYADDPEGDYEWFSSREGTLPFYKTPRKEFFLKFYEKGKAGETFHVEEFIGEDCKDHYEYLMTLPVIGDALQEIVDAGASLPDSQYDHVAFFKHGYVLFITYEPVPDAHDIFKRFSQVFEQTYTRFLDLQKAENQARESEIQLALERVRARTMAMHNSSELGEVAAVLFEQISSLNSTPDRFNIAIANEADESFDIFITDQSGFEINNTFNAEIKSSPVLAEAFENWKNDAAHLIQDIHGKKLENWIRYMGDIVGIPFNMEQVKEHCFLCSVFFSHGFIGITTHEEPDSEVIHLLERFCRIFQQTYIRFLDLQKAENQAREAQIEASLEKVRAQSMGMQTSEDLSKVASVMFDQMKLLGGELFAFGIVLCNKDKDTVQQWHNLGNEGMISPFKVPVDLDYIHRYRYDQWLAGEKLFSIEIPEDYITEHFNLMFGLPSVKAIMDEIAGQGVDVEIPDWEIDYGASFKHGYLLVSSHKSFEESQIFPRFAKVFDQAYTRFLDLKKAESQAREAQIEAALERVRARSMGMQKSDELIEVVREIGKGIHELGIQIHYSQIFTDYSHDPKTGVNIWVDVEGLNYLEKFHIPYIDHLITQRFYNPLNNGLDFSDNQYLKSDKDSYFKLLFKHSDLKRIPEKRKELILEAPGWTRVTVILENSSLNFGRYSLDEFTNDEKEIFKRVGKVFGQAYTRFLDLQKAEKQAREAQIENALEKVRSRSLAMQHPDELIEVAQLLREEMGALGVEELETSSIYIYDDISGLTQCWFTIKDSNDPDKSVTDQMSIDLKDTWVGRQMNEFYRSKQDKTSILMKGEKRIEWIRYCEEKSDLFGNSEFYGETIPERTYHLYKFSNGFLGAASPGNISDESWDLMKRATLVFSFAYTRFNDLQKAEESALRAKQQASLDRIRADISSMRTADDLNRVTPLVWRELNTLGIPFIRCGVFIIHKEEEQVEVYLSKPDGTSLAVMHLPFGSSDLAIQTVNAWEKGAVSTQHWTQAEFLEWGRSMVEQGQVPDMESYQGAEEAPESLHLHFLPFNQGMLYVGSTVALNEEEIHLSESLSEAFSIAYARYEDFVKLEKAKAGIENALSDLKATQSQLVQQEKLASLGQLTAGIAHEIKNPLNFVNNFSELSVELIEEVREELSGVSNQLSADDRDKVDEAVEILYDIETNLKTIHKHGSRADSIVKSMLQHSRGGDGKMEPTPLNPLIKEYVNLAFHGMRAGKDPINVDIDLQLDEIVDEIPLIAEDFSRVILNLVNNAFDAMREKISETSKVKSEKSLRQPTEGASPSGEGEVGDVTEYSYQPKLTVRTHQTEKNVIVEIEDNGPGISDEMKDKIMQPFFTTKKGTDGTGLGLSITNDIIKAHAGKLEIYSKDQRTIISLTISK